MKVHITIAEDAGAAPAAGAERQLSVGRDTTGAVDAGPAPAAGAEQSVTTGYFTAPEAASAPPAGSVMDGGEAPDWLTELVRRADAGEVARPGEESDAESESQETRQSSAGVPMDAGHAPAAG